MDRARAAVKEGPSMTREPDPIGAGDQIERRFGRGAFGADPQGYDTARPPYPDWVFEALASRSALRPGAAVFEIGAGPGTATGELLARGADPLVAIEPDRRLCAYLASRWASPALTVRAEPFEDVDLEPGAFDLGVCATAFHWLEEHAALARIAAALRPGGWWAPVWNVFGDPSQEDRFHEATRAFLEDGPRSPSDGGRGTPYALDVDARLDALARTGAFAPAGHISASWSLTLTADEVVRLYATFSNIAARPDRTAILARLHDVAAHDFADRVTRNMTTILYLARRL
jgi:SAM-dependent methyltransferase